MHTHTDTQGLGPYILSASARRGDIRLDERFPGIIDIIGLFAKRNSPAFPLLSLSLPADTHRWLVDEADPLEILSLYKGLIRSCERASARASPCLRRCLFVRIPSSSLFLSPSSCFFLFSRRCCVAVPAASASTYIAYIYLHTRTLVPCHCFSLGARSRSPSSLLLYEPW